MNYSARSLYGAGNVGDNFGHAGDPVSVSLLLFLCMALSFVRYIVLLGVSEERELPTWEIMSVDT